MKRELIVVLVLAALMLYVGGLLLDGGVWSSDNPPVSVAQIVASTATVVVTPDPTPMFLLEVPPPPPSQGVLLAARLFPVELEDPGDPFPERVEVPVLPDGVRSIPEEYFQAAGFGSTLASRLAYASWAYLAAQEETGIRWEVFAALHIMEHSAISSNPGNGQGPLQMTGPWQRQYNMSFPAGPLDQAGLLRTFLESADAVLAHFDAAENYIDPAKVSGPITINSESEEVQGEFAYTYNGRAYGSSYMNSGYVAVGYAGITSLQVCAVDGCAYKTAMTRDGYLANFYKLVNIRLS